MEEKKEETFINKLFAKIDEKFGPSKIRYQPACQDVREMLIECVMESSCMTQNRNSFKQCIGNDIDKECKAIRYDYMLCRKSQVYWTKHFSKDDPR